MVLFWKIHKFHIATYFSKEFNLNFQLFLWVSSSELFWSKSYPKWPYQCWRIFFTHVASNVSRRKLRSGTVRYESFYRQCFRDHCAVPYNLLYCVQTNQARITVIKRTENVNAYLLLPSKTKSVLNRVQTGRRNKKVGSNAIIYLLAKSTSCLNSKI